MKREGGGLMQFVKFCVVGVLNTAVDWVVYYLLISYIMFDVSEKSLAKLISFIVAVINSYIWNTVWTFRAEYKKTVSGTGNIKTGGTVFMRFVLVSLVGWGINYLAFRATISQISSPDIIALVVASGAAVVWNFFVNKLWTYKK